MSTINTPSCFSPGDLRCKSPYGAAATGSTVQFTLRPPGRRAL